MKSLKENLPNVGIFFVEAKFLRVSNVTISLNKGEILKEGKDLTIISYGRPLYTCQAAIEQFEKEVPGASVELIHLRTLYPWDQDLVVKSVGKTGKAIVVHESMVNYGVGAEVAAKIQEKAF